MPRFAAGLVALVCWCGLAVQIAATYSVQDDIAATLWIIARFFTVLTNLALAVIMTGVAARRRISPFLLGGITLAILLVGIVYATLLVGLQQLHGLALIADVLLHKASPGAMTLWWLLFAPHRKLQKSAPLLWSFYPLAYFGYAAGRGIVDGKYPYPFIDVGRLGWPQTLLNAGGIAFAFVLGGLALVALDRILPGGAKGRG
ncbi:MAG TPA: Pr6Pr family membrane protein [Sphingomicrobium sp.]|nr:Pr6Pr family membrane protein [Sphingomicrobium sp.]